MAGTVSMLCVILVTILAPPVGILLISGCTADLCINILLTILGYVPGLIHALYLEHVYYSRRDPRALPERDAPGVYSDRIQHGGHDHQTERTYGTV